MIVKYKELRRVKTGERPKIGSAVVYGYSTAYSPKFPRIYIKEEFEWLQLVNVRRHQSLSYPSMYTVIFDETEI